VPTAQSDAGDGKRDAWGGSGAVDGEVESVVAESGDGAACRACGAFLAAAVDSVVGSVRDVVVEADREQHLEAVALLWGNSAFRRVLSNVAGVGDSLETLRERRPAVAAALAHAGMGPDHVAVPVVVDGSGCLLHHCCTPLVAADMLKAGHAAQVRVDAILLLLLMLLPVLHHCGRGYRV